MKVLVPGSYDPFHLGHEAILEQVSTFSKEICIGIFHNPNKKTLFSIDERVDMIEKMIEEEL
jgi:pantetheine-phosphate adenylyltransferase